MKTDLARNRPPFGVMLASLRNARGKSQLALSLEADVSARHVSFLETGRSSPTRDMVGRLARALKLTAAERCALMAAAGYRDSVLPAQPETTLPGGHGTDDFEAMIAIETARTEDHAVATAAKLLARLGLTQFYTGTLQRICKATGRALQICHHQIAHAPLGWMLHYRERNYRSVDPLVRAALHRHLPFFWSDLFAAGPLIPEVHNMLHEAGDFRITNGFVMPIHRVDGMVHALSAMGESLDTDDPRIRISARAVSVALLHRIDALGLPAEDAELALDQQERDWLAYILEGRPVTWLADRYQLDEFQAGRKMSAISLRMGTSDSLEAALRACRAGLLPAI